MLVSCGLGKTIQKLARFAASITPPILRKHIFVKGGKTTSRIETSLAYERAEKAGYIIQVSTRSDSIYPDHGILGFYNVVPLLSY